MNPTILKIVVLCSILGEVVGMESNDRGSSLYIVLILGDLG